MSLFSTIKKIAIKAVAIFQESQQVDLHSDEGQLKFVATTAEPAPAFPIPASNDGAAFDQPMDPAFNNLAWPEQPAHQPQPKKTSWIVEATRKAKQKNKELNKLNEASPSKTTTTDKTESSDLAQPKTAETSAASEIFNKLNDVSSAVQQFSYDTLKSVHSWNFGTHSGNNHIAVDDPALQIAQNEKSAATMFLDLVGAGCKGLANLTLKAGYTSLYITHSLLIDQKSYGNNGTGNNTLAEKDAFVMASDLLCFGAGNILKITSNAGDLIDRSANDAYKYLTAINSYNHLNKNGCDLIKMVDAPSEDSVLVDLMGYAAISAAI